MMKIRKLLSLVLAALLMLSLTPVRVRADEQACGDSAYWRLEDGTLTIWGSGEMYNYLDEGREVPWLEMRDQITTVVVEEGITLVGMAAFQRLPNLTAVSLPDSLIVIDCFAFQRCPSLETVVFPDGLRTIGQHAFSMCYALNHIEIPASVTWVDACVFEACTSLTDVLFRSDPDLRVFMMGNSVFRSCTSLENIRVEDGHWALRSINGILYFYEQTGTMILNDYPCGRQDTVLRVADTTTRIQQLAVSCIAAEANPWLETVIFPASVNWIGMGAFQYLPNLKRMEFMGSAPDIRRDAVILCHEEITLVHPCGDPSWEEARNTWDIPYLLGDSTIIWEERHTFGDWTVMTEPDGGADGLRQRDCSTCGHRETEVIPGTVVIPGDVDGSGAIDADDAIHLLYYTLFGDDLYPVSQSCDFNGSGAVDTDDAIYLLYHTLFGAEMYPLGA